MTKPPIWSVTTTAHGLTIVDEGAAAKALAAFQANITQCMSSGDSPYPPKIAAVFRSMGRDHKIDVYPNASSDGGYTIKVTPVNIEIVFKLVEYGDPGSKKHPRDRGQIIWTSERPRYELVPDDHGD